MSYILGITYNGTDSSACLFNEDGLMCAVEEERFTRNRHEGSFPRNSILWCLKFAGIKENDVDVIAVSWDYDRYETMSGRSSISKFYKMLENRGEQINWDEVNNHIQRFNKLELLNTMSIIFPALSSKPILFFRHHDCHAASSYCFSGFNRSLVVVLDEKGEDICSSVYLGVGPSIQLLESYKIPNSLGLFYAAATQYLHFKPFRDEGTFMALATYGEIDVFLKAWLLDKVISYQDGAIKINTRMISKAVFEYPRSSGSLYTEAMVQNLTKFGIQRLQSIKAIEMIHKNFAATIQDVLESVVIQFIIDKVKKYRVGNLCISGGVGLNCTLNGKILTTSPLDSEIENLFIPPWCHDGGGAIGAAIIATGNKQSDNVISFRQYPKLTRADWGPGFSNELIEADLKRKGLAYSRSKCIARDVAQLLAEGKVVAWFQGRAEFGPRALGQRSFLSHPRNKDSTSRLQCIKRRLSFRPFAPSILEEYSSRYFASNGANTEFMTIAFKANQLAHEEIPDAINSIDSSLRVQTVNKKMGLYRNLLEEYYKLTGIPGLLNTSFNISEPAVLTPEDAIFTFIQSKADFLAIGDFLVNSL